MRYQHPGPVLLAAAAFLIAHGQAFGCADVGGSEKIYAGVKKAVVKIVAAGSGDGCSNTGTGFVVSETGHVLTAKHVVPMGCKNLSLLVSFENSREPVQMEVARISAHDAVLLRPLQARHTPEYLQIADARVPEDTYLEKRVLVVSFYPDLPRVTYTVAKVDAVELVGDVRGKWSLCGPAANPGRSGSPVVTDEGKAVAVFIERPGGEQDRARVVPITYLTDLGIADLQKRGGSPVNAATQSPSEISYAFALHYNVKGFAAPKRDNLYLFDDHGFQDASGMSPIEIAARLSQGAVLRARQELRPTFNAQPGYVFDATSLNFHVASQNPPTGPLPASPCATQSSTDCFEVSQDRRLLTLRLRLFPGIDGANAWLHGDFVALQVLASK